MNSKYIIRSMFASPFLSDFFVVEQDCREDSFIVSKISHDGSCLWRQLTFMKGIVGAGCSLDGKNVVIASRNQVALLDCDGIEQKHETICSVERVVAVNSGIYVQAIDGLIYSYGTAPELPPSSLPGLISVSPESDCQIRCGKEEEEYVLTFCDGRQIDLVETGAGILKTFWSGRWLFICASAEALQIIDTKTGSTAFRIIPEIGWHYGDIYFDEKSNIMTACKMCFQDAMHMMVDNFYFDGKSIEKKSSYEYSFYPLYAVLFSNGERYATKQRSIIDCLNGGLVGKF